MFFFLAPVIQLESSPFFPNSLPIEPNDMIKANGVILLWNIVYLVLRTRRKINPDEAVIRSNEQNGLHLINNKVRALYFLAAILMFLITFAQFKFDFFFGNVDYAAKVSNKSILLLVNICFQGTVFANWVFSFDNWKRQKGMASFLNIGVSSIIFVYQISPFNTNRFYIGLCIIMIVYLFFHKKVSPSKFVGVIFVGLLVIFPLLNNFRNGLKEVEIPSLYHLMLDQLTELHFDAYSNLIATFHYVEANGLAYGYQMLGVLLFFVPRNIWPGKPLSSGEAVGDFISTRFEMDFSNISNPIPSEFFINFGWFGVILGAFLVARMVNKLESDTLMNRYTHALIAGYLFIIYRGDLMNAFAYCFGTFVIMVLVPNLLSKLSKKQLYLPPIGKLNNG
ncbi:hypothetical protein [Cohnella silvisoli]|uniref:Oligosaccharide repeat unit polymerase n=1 Tax=Cohnella silvisoli TaxID=2873699 RepID=A0ABV1KVY9_9BACL|nr:hypothetical protein [Cohnella silvisoli]MCD9023653.1 hypothetical protein [Cohnella silvisoli]